MANSPMPHLYIADYSVQPHSRAQPHAPPPKAVTHSSYNPTPPNSLVNLYGEKHQKTSPNRQPHQLKTITLTPLNRRCRDENLFIAIGIRPNRPRFAALLAIVDGEHEDERRAPKHEQPRPRRRPEQTCAKSPTRSPDVARSNHEGILG